MLKQIERNKIEKLELELRQAHRVIYELLGGLECENREVRQLIYDTAFSYMETVRANNSRHLDGSYTLERQGVES